MWDILKKTDIDQVKYQLRLRRAEIIKRHSEENQNLDTDHVEVERLNLLISAFAQKFIKPSTVPRGPVQSPVSAKAFDDKATPDERNQNHRNRPRTNFDTFAHAMSRR